MVQMQAAKVARGLQEAEEQLLKLQRETAEALIQLSRPDADCASSPAESTWSDQGSVGQARRKRQRAQQGLKELRELSAQKAAHRERQAIEAMRQLEECTNELTMAYNKMIQ